MHSINAKCDKLVGVKPVKFSVSFTRFALRGLFWVLFGAVKSVVYKPPALGLSVKSVSIWKSKMLRRLLVVLLVSCLTASSQFDR